MKFAVTIIIFVYCFVSSAANDVFPSDLLNWTKCHDDLITLNFSNSVIRYIGQDFISSPIITCLNFEHNNIENIANGAFDKLPNLTNLYLSYNVIDSQDLFSFGSHEKLRVLWLDSAANEKNKDNNYLVKLYYELQISATYPNLEYLSMRQNNLGNMEKKKFYREDFWQDDYDDYNNTFTTNINQNTEIKVVFPKLKYLDLSNNGFAYDSFVELLPDSLMYLYLHDNNLQSLHLNNLKKLTVLTLHNNKLFHISNDLLKGLENLKYLSLANNEIQQIENTTFIDTVTLNYLNLSNNDLYFLDPEVLTNLQSLETLDLSQNKLTTFFAPTHGLNITVLSLSYNKITRIDSFPMHMPKLMELLLNNNQIKEIYTHAFSNLYNLVKLDLSKNELSFLPINWTKAFTSLKYLDMSNNYFTSLESLSLTKEMPLLTLYLEMNPLLSFNIQSIESLPQNVTVNLAERLVI